MNTDSSNELGEAGRRRPEDSTTADRLTHLPEPILSHILSFLDTKSAVQTCVLARAWRCAWKQVRALNLRSDCFQNYPSFRNFVDMVISLRHPVSVEWVRFMDEGRWGELEISLLVRVIEHSLSHDAQHMVIELVDKRVSDNYKFAESFGGIVNGIGSNLKSLKLRGFLVDGGFDCSCFPMLNTLELGSCQLVSGPDGGFGFFSSFHCLENLVLTRCVPFDQDVLCGLTSLKLFGPRLLSLRMTDDFFLNMEVSAPKLSLFSLHGPLPRFLGLSAPSVDNADIRIHRMDATTETHPGWEKAVFEQRFKPLFQSLHNAKSLTLGSLTIKVLSEASELLEQRPSPFTRLECLNLQSDSVPDEVVNYFLRGSSSGRPTVEFLST